MLRYLLLVALVAPFSLTAQSVTLVADSFADGSRSEQNLPEESAWYTKNENVVRPTLFAEEGVLRLAMAPDSTQGSLSEMIHTYFTAPGEALVLGVGESITATLTFTATGLNSANPATNSFRLGLFHSNGVRVEEDGAGDSGNPGSRFQNYTGYADLHRIGLNTGGSAFSMRKRDLLSTTSLLGSTNAYSTLGGGPTDGQALSNGTLYSITLDITRLTATSVRFRSYMEGGGLIAYGHERIDESNPYYTFDTFALRVSSGADTAQEFRFLSFRVEHVLSPIDPDNPGEPVDPGPPPDPSAGLPNFNLVGYATVPAAGVNGTTGGFGGDVVTPTTLEEFQAYAGSFQRRIIVLDRKFTGPATVVVTSNKTIVGVDDLAELDGVGLDINGQSNVIIRNIRLYRVPATHNDGDGIRVRNGSTHVWIDHCEVFNENPFVQTNKDFYDGLIDITNGSDFVTVSWCVLRDHHKFMLIGSTDSDTYNDSQHLRVTLHHTWLHNPYVPNQRLGTRLPSLRFGRLHMYNNYLLNLGEGPHSRNGACLRLERNVMEYCVRPLMTSNAGRFDYLDNLLIRMPGPDAFIACTLEIPYAYAATLHEAVDVLDIVPAWAGVGRIDYRAEILGRNPPAIIQGPVGGTVAVGGEIRLSVEADGVDVIVYQWRRNGENLPDQKSSELVISSAAEADSGFYDVLVSNPYGTTVATAAAITVGEATAPTFAAWAIERGYTGEDAAPGADPDGNGLANAVEYALGLPAGSAPGSWAQARPAEVIGDITYVVFFIPLLQGAQGVTVTPQVSATAGGPFGPVSGLAGALSEPTSGGLLVKLPQSAAGAFLALEVSY